VSTVRVLAGRVPRLCDHGGGLGWGVWQHDGGTLLVRISVSDDAPVLRTLGSAVAAAVEAARDEDLPAELLQSALRVARGLGWPDVGDVLWAAAQHRSVAVRLEAARHGGTGAVLTGAEVALTWLLAHDAELRVRAAALTAALERCRVAGGVTCAEMIGYFTADEDPEIGWRARHALLSVDPDRALQGASLAYKLDALATLSVRVETDAPAFARRALDLLTRDLDPEVRRTAVLIVNRLNP
jgi:hypothetical protein